MPNDAIENWLERSSQSVILEIERRTEELTQLEKEQVQLGTTVPQLFGSLSRFVANPSSVSVESYSRALNSDETIGAGVEFLILAMISRWGDYKHKNKAIQEFVRKCLEQMEGSWHKNLEEILSAEWAGFSVTEKIWQYDENFGGFPAFRPRRLVTYPPLTCVFALDRAGRLLPNGVLQYQRYHNTFGQGISGNVNIGGSGGDLGGFRPDLYASVGDSPYPIRISADLSYLAQPIPSHKIIHVTSSVPGSMGNPYGKSLLRRIYKNWVAKDAFLKMWIIAADRKGTPLVVGYADPHTTVEGENQFSGVNPNGEGVYANRGMRGLGSGGGDAPSMMADAFKTIHNSSFLVLPGKKGEVYDVEAISIQGDLNVFINGMEYFNKAIMRGLLIPPLVMGGDGGGSFALGQEHNKIFAKIIDGKLKAPKQAVLSSFIKDIIAYNFPREEWEKDGYGDFALEEFDAELMEKLANVFSNLTSAGFMSPEDQQDMDDVRKRFGLSDKVAKPQPKQDFSDLFGGGAGTPDKDEESAAVDSGIGNPDSQIEEMSAQTAIDEAHAAVVGTQTGQATQARAKLKKSPRARVRAKKSPDKGA